MSSTWLNSLLSRIWPVMTRILANDIRKDLEKDLNDPKNSVKATLERLSFGDQPVKLDRVTVTTPKDNALLISFDMVWDNKPDISIAIQKVGSVGLSQLHLSGRIGILLQPLGGDNLMGAIQLYFFDPPELDLNFTGLARVAQIPFLKNLIRSTLRQEFNKKMVLPNRVFVPLDNEILNKSDIIAQLYPPPVGVLRLQILEATNLPARDRSWWGLGSPISSDPYCNVTVGEDCWRTSTVNKNLNPKWDNQQHDFLVSSTGQTLFIELYDEDIAKSDFLGKTRVTLPSNGEIWLPVANENKDSQILLRSSWLGTTNKSQWQDGPGIVHVVIHNIEYNEFNSDSVVEPYVVVTVNKQIKETAPSSKKPESWNQAFYYLVDSPGIEITLEVKSGGNSLGSVVLSAADFANSNHKTGPALLSSNVPELKLNYYVHVGGLVESTLETLLQKGGWSLDPPEESSIAESMSDVKWVNKMLSGLWKHLEPSISKGFRKEEDTFENSFAMPGLRFTDCTFGTNPFYFKEINSPNNIANDYAVLDMDFGFDSNCKIELSDGQSKLGLSNLKVNGKLAVVIGPLKLDPPSLGTMSIYFHNTPHVTMDLIGEAKSWYMKGVFRDMILEMLSRSLVLPNKSFADLSAEPFKIPPEIIKELQYPLPAYILYLKEVRARNLPSSRSQSKANSYCEVRCGNDKLVTQIEMYNAEPTWKIPPGVFIPVYDPRVQNVTVTAVDGRLTKDDVFLGCASFPTELLKESDQGQDIIWAPLMSEDLSQPGQGEVGIRVIPHVPNTTTLVQGKIPSIVSVWLKDMKLNRTSDNPFDGPLVEVKLGRDTQRTDVISKKSRNPGGQRAPILNAVYHFVASHPLSQQVELNLIWSSEGGATEEKIANITIDTDQLLKCKGQKLEGVFEWHPELFCSLCGPRAPMSITLSLALVSLPSAEEQPPPCECVIC